MNPAFGRAGRYLDRVRRTFAARERAAGSREELPGGRDRWIEVSLQWLLAEFGRDVLMRPVVRPAELIPVAYAGTESAARALFAAVCTLMDLSVEKLELRFDLGGSAVLTGEPEGSDGRQESEEFLAGLWTLTEAGSTIAVAPRLIGDPVRLVATFAHELGHELLVGSGRIEPTHPAHESLTDLLTIFTGLGVFTANAAIGYIPTRDGKGRRMVAHGYLREGALSEALAHYALLRGELGIPRWTKDLDRSVRWLTIGRLERLRSRRAK